MSIRSNVDAALTNPKAYFGNYGAVIKAGEKTSSFLPGLEDDRTFLGHDASVSGKLKAIAAVQNSFLADRINFKEKTAETALLKGKDGALLENLFIRTMNISDAVGTFLANGIFKITPTRLIGNAGSVAALPAFLVRAAALVVGAAVCVGIVAPIEFLVVSFDRLIRITLPVIRFALPYFQFMLPFFTIRIPEFFMNIVFPAIVLVGFGIYEFALKPLAYLVAAVVILATSLSVDTAKGLLALVGEILYHLNPRQKRINEDIQKTLIALGANVEKDNKGLLGLIAKESLTYNFVARIITERSLYKGVNQTLQAYGQWWREKLFGAPSAEDASARPASAVVRSLASRGAVPLHGLVARSPGGAGGSDDEGSVESATGGTGRLRARSFDDVRPLLAAGKTVAARGGVPSWGPAGDGSETGHA